jgi:tetratricopeptide (TPR) repeat protein
LTDDYGSFLLFKKEDVNQAKKYYQKSVDLNPRSIYYWSQLVDLVEDHEKNVIEADKIYRKMLRLFPYSHKTFLNYGVFKFYINDYPKAIEYLSKSLKLNP